MNLVAISSQTQLQRSFELNREAFLEREKMASNEMKYILISINIKTALAHKSIKYIINE